MSMHIAMVSDHASPLAAPGSPGAGGQNVHVRELALALAAEGHRITVLTRRDSPEPPDVVELAAHPDGGSAHVHHLTAGPASCLSKERLVAHVPRFAEELVRVWRADRPDVVHAHHWMSGLAALAAVRDLEIPLVQTFHGLGHVERRHAGEHDSGPAGRPSAEQVISRQADRIVATCEDELFELVRMGAPRKRISIVPSGVDVETFRPDGPALVRRERPRLVSVGRLVPRAGVDDLITALARVPDAELLVGGGTGTADDPDLARLFGVAGAVGVADRVRFLGPVARTDVPRLLRSADAVVSTPRHQPFGRVALEAMACGRAVVATAVGGMKDTVVDRVTGVLVPPRRPDHLADTLRRLLADRAMPVAYGIAGRDRVLSRYTWPRIAAATTAVYAQALGHRSDAGAESGEAGAPEESTG
jgi:glycosyltransferase involved in cell wall biosynthesis